MNLISQIIYAVITMIITGTLGLWIWYMTQEILQKCHPGLPYLLLRIICLMYVLPVGYIIIQTARRDGYVYIDGLWQMNFALAGILRLIVDIVCLIWLVLTGRQTYVCLFVWHRGRMWRATIAPETDARVCAEFERVKAKLHIRRPIGLYRSSMAFSPKTYGVYRCMIVLPDDTYSQKQLSVIFHHELMHCKSYDVFYKLCSVYVVSFYRFKGLGYKLLVLLNELSEYYCDIRAIEAIRDEMSAAEYFRMILDVIEQMAGRRKAENDFSGLGESRSRIERRIDYMMKYKNAKARLNAAAVAVAALFVLTNVTTVYAAESGLSDLYDILYQKVEPTMAEVSKSEDLEEFYIPAAEDNTYERLEYADPEEDKIAPALNENELVSFNWTVSPGTRTASKTFYVKKGQSISMSATISPGGATCWIGIMDPQNSVRYVEGTDSLSHTFAVDQSGFYRVFVQNRGSSGSITAAGSYMYHTP